MKPIIGIMTRSGVNENNTPLQFVFESIRQAVIYSNGVPLYLTPPQNISYYQTHYQDFPPLTSEEKEIINYQLSLIDGLLLPGGSKMTYYDFYVLKECLKRNIPVLGICLGMQIIANLNINNFTLLDVPNQNIHHHPNDITKTHPITIEKNSILYKILQKDNILVNSNHTKMVDYTKECSVIARSSDNVIEAVELKNYDFCLGVQWHPEKDILTNSDSKKIFSYFLQMAQKYKKNKEKTNIKLNF